MTRLRYEKKVWSGILWRRAAIRLRRVATAINRNIGIKNQGIIACPWNFYAVYNRMVFNSHRSHLNLVQNSQMRIAQGVHVQS